MLDTGDHMYVSLYVQINVVFWQRFELLKQIKWMRVNFTSKERKKHQQHNFKKGDADDTSVSFPVVRRRGGHTYVTHTHTHMSGTYVTRDVIYNSYRLMFCVYWGCANPQRHMKCLRYWHRRELDQELPSASYIIIIKATWCLLCPDTDPDYTMFIWTTTTTNNLPILKWCMQVILTIIVKNNNAGHKDVNITTVPKLIMSICTE